MPYEMKPLACDPARIKGMSERLIVSHYENNYGGAVKRLNLIEEQLAGLDFAIAPGFVVNGLKREQLVAMNSMILHEVFFDGLGEESEPGSELVDALARDFGSLSGGALSSQRWARHSAAARAGSCSPGRRATACSSINGRPTTP
jgi:superoxide dismutase, Fe-Mn family